MLKKIPGISIVEMAKGRLIKVEESLIEEHVDHPGVTDSPAAAVSVYNIDW